MARTTKIWLIFTGVFLAGGVCGGFVSLRVAKMMVERGRGPDRFSASVMNRYVDRLGLTEAQCESIRPLLDSALDEMRRARRETYQSIQALEEDISAKLTPEQLKLLAEYQHEQKEKWSKLVEKRDQERREGGPGGKPPPPPPPEGK